MQGAKPWGSGLIARAIENSKRKNLPVAVPRDHVVFLATRGPVEITRLMDCPLLVRKYPADRMWKDDHDGYWYDNQSVTFLHMNADPESQQWGWAPREWDGPGSVFVVRQDGKDIWPKQVEALCEFIQDRLQSLFEDSIGAGLVSRTKQEVIDYMTKKKNFETFFENYKREQVRRDPSWATETCPLM